MFQPLCLALAAQSADRDWLITPVDTISSITRDGDGLTMTNGLVSRIFTLSPAFGTVDFRRHAELQRGGDQSLFRSVHPEAIITFDRNRTFAVGGLIQKRTFLAYCNRSDFALSSDPDAFRFVNYSVSDPVAPFPWIPGTRHSPKELKWPPPGKRLSVVFEAPASASEYAHLRVELVYTIFDGAPLITKALNIDMIRPPMNTTAIPRRPTEMGPGPAVQGWSPDSAAAALTFGPQGVTLTTASSSGGSVGASFTGPSNGSVGIVLAAPVHPGASETQTSLGLGTSSAPPGSRDMLDFWASCDSGGLYAFKKGESGRPAQFGDCKVGDAIALGIDGTRGVALFRNSVAVAWLPGPIPPDLHPHVLLLPGGYTATALSPVFGPPPPPPPPPPSPPEAPDVLVSSVTVELVGAAPRYGKYLTHGSHAPGSDGYGSASAASPGPLLDAKSDQAHGAGCSWVDDEPNSKDDVVRCTECKDEGAIEPYLNCSYASGPGAHVSFAPAERFQSFRALLLVHDSDDLERQALGRHRATQLLAPHTTENPVFFHATDVTPSGFRETIDQMSEVGMEMLIFSFGSGFNLETADPVYLAKIKMQVEYARTKGIEVGGYDLICLDRTIKPSWQAVDTDGHRTGNVCFASGWHDKLTTLVSNFINKTGLAMLETDGPYGGEVCSSHNHVHHHGLEDSVYRQTALQGQFYAELRKKNVYVNQPDMYFFQGGSKTGMGYDEQQYSLPRWRDLTISRMGMYDDLYTFSPTQGWMFLPLDDYHAGGSAAAFSTSPEAYEYGLAQYLGAGVAACYRGRRPYLTDQIRAMVTKWIGFYKAHRGTLIQPIVHLRRPDLQGWDGWLHVNPFKLGGQNSVKGSRCPEVGLAMLFNPTDITLTNQSVWLPLYVAIAFSLLFVWLPLYYTGAVDKVVVQLNNGNATTMVLDRHFGVTIEVPMPPRSIHTVAVGTCPG